MLTTVRSVAVVDRTGAIQSALRWGHLDVIELRATDLDLEVPDVDVLLVGARELTGAGRRRISRWRRMCPAGTVIAHVDDLSVDRELLRLCGVAHTVRGKLTPGKLDNALLHADVSLGELLVATGRMHPIPYPDEQMVVPAQSEPAHDEDDGSWYDEQDVELDIGDADDNPQPGQRARLLTVASATGGCGKTFYATNIASLFARSGARVLVIDLDLQFGEVAAALQVQHAYSLYDGLYGTSGERLAASAMREHLDDLVHHHPLGFDVLTAPRDPVLADFVGARDAMTLLDAALPRYDIVIADTPPSLNDVVIAALDRSDAVCVLATLDVPSLRNLTAFLDVLRRLALEDDRIRLVLNKAERDVGVTVEQAQDAFDGRFEAVLPVDRAVSRSVNLGTTVVEHEPKAKVSRALVVAVEPLLHALGFLARPPASATDPDVMRSRTVGAMFRRLVSGGSA
jgi:Flp pilus assembly CpaE family ATPase